MVSDFLMFSIVMIIIQHDGWSKLKVALGLNGLNIKIAGCYSLSSQESPFLIARPQKSATYAAFSRSYE
jgi:hypothetical protein